jgi:hypothetical protein
MGTPFNVGIGTQIGELLALQFRLGISIDLYLVIDESVNQIRTKMGHQFRSPGHRQIVTQAVDRALALESEVAPHVARIVVTPHGQPQFVAHPIAQPGVVAQDEAMERQIHGYFIDGFVNCGTARRLVRHDHFHSVIGRKKRQEEPVVAAPTPVQTGDGIPVVGRDSHLDIIVVLQGQAGHLTDKAAPGAQRKAETLAQRTLGMETGVQQTGVEHRVPIVFAGRAPLQLHHTANAATVPGTEAAGVQIDTSQAQGIVGGFDPAEMEQVGNVHAIEKEAGIVISATAHDDGAGIVHGGSRHAGQGLQALDHVSTEARQTLDLEHGQ